MAVTLELQPDGSIRVSRCFIFNGAIVAAAKALEGVNESAFNPAPSPQQPDPQRVEAYLEQHDEDASTAHLKAGEAERSA